MPSWIPRVNGYSPGSPSRSSSPSATSLGSYELVDLDARVGEDALVVRARDRGDVAVLARVDFDRLGVGLGLGLSIGHGPERIWPSHKLV